MEPCLVTGLPHHRTIAALDIEQSTTRTDPVKADLRDKMYGLFDEALRSAGIQTPIVIHSSTAATGSWVLFTRWSRRRQQYC
jgi:hypothetical protein